MPKKIIKTKKKEIKKVKKVKKPKEKKVKKVKAKEEKVKKKEIVKPKVKKPARYFEAVGRRKTAVARVRLWTQGEQEFLVNNKSYQDYFSNSELQQIATDSLRKMKSLDRFRIKVLVKGSGLYSQAEATRHGISRVLVKFNPDFKKRLRRVGFLTRDPRMRERKKFGLKRARRAPQWRKR
jgi:small subunit ribosomal protein S9